MAIKKICPHCGPLAVNHFASWLNNFIEYFINQLDKRLSGFWARMCSGFIGKAQDRFLLFFLAAFQKAKIISLKTDFERHKIYNRTLVFLDEAKARGIEAGAVLICGRYSNHFFAQIGGRKIFFEGLPLGKSSGKAEKVFIDDKAELKKILRQNNLPFVEGKSFWSRKNAFDYGLALGFPLVVKPRWGSISRHTFINIQNRLELSEAIKGAGQISPWIIVERYLPEMEVFRATIVNFRLGGAAKRMPANVIGDGCLSVQELVEAKNMHPWRGQPRQKDCTYLKIVLDKKSEELLRAQGLALNSVPDKERRVFLQEKIILDLGADLIEMTGLVHQDNILLFEQVAKIFGTKLVGIDFLCQDIAVSWQAQKCAIIELNSLPFIDMHHFPLEGQPRNLASQLWEMVLEEQNL